MGDFDDRRLAFVSLLEGDATLVMERFLMKRLSGSMLGGASDMSQLSWPTPPVPGVPPVVRDQLVLALRRWAATSRARCRSGAGGRP